MWSVWITGFPLAIADSLNASAVGVIFAFWDVNIIPATLLIGITTFLFSAAGIKIGSQFGIRYKSNVAMAGGMILIMMGLMILLKHTEIL